MSIVAALATAGVGVCDAGCWVWRGGRVFFCLCNVKTALLNQVFEDLPVRALDWRRAGSRVQTSIYSCNRRL